MYDRSITLAEFEAMKSTDSLQTSETYLVEGTPYVARSPRTAEVSPGFATAVRGAVRTTGMLTDPENWRDFGPIASRPSAMASWSWISILDTSTVPTITAPLGKYYLYTATDHETRGGIRLLYANSIDGPWTLYTGGLATGDSTIIYEDLDDTASRSPAISTETPDVRWDAAAGKLRMFYHCVNPSFGDGTGALTNPSDPGGARSGCTAYIAGQGTMSALSDDGLRWTKDRAFSLDVYASNADAYACDHTGYFGISEYRGMFCGYHSIGGTLAGGHGLSRAYKLSEWISDVRQLPRYTTELSALGLPDYDMTYQWDVDWLGGRIIESTDGPVLVTKARLHKLLSVLNGPTRLIAAPLTDDLRRFRSPPRVIGQGLLPFQKEGMSAFHDEATYGNGLDVVFDEQGLCIVYLTDNHMGVLRYVG
jgi:hypothetical protein